MPERELISLPEFQTFILYDNLAQRGNIEKGKPALEHQAGKVERAYQHGTILACERGESTMLTRPPKIRYC
jgi:hypothetical protein